MVEQANASEGRRGCSCLPFFRGWGRPFRNLFGRSNSNNTEEQRHENRGRANSQVTRMRGIQATRQAFASSWFDETACRDGLARLANYRKRWDKTRGCWSSDPLHDDNSHGSDAFRQFGQVLEAGEQFRQAFRVHDNGKVEKVAQRWRKARGSGMAV